MSEEQETEDGVGEWPKVSGSPDRIWLVYGDIDENCTHDECHASGEVTWCHDQIYDSDVEYVLRSKFDEVCAAFEAKIAALEGDVDGLNAACDSLTDSLYSAADEAKDAP